MLRWIACHAPRLMALGVVLGLFLPSLATLARPLLVPTLVVPLALALVRLEWRAMTRYRRRPGLIAALLAWLLVVSPAGIAAATHVLVRLGLPQPLQEALVLMAASSPIVSSVPIALMLGLDAGLAVVVVLTATALVPFTLPVAARSLLGVDFDLALGPFMLRLALLVGSAFAGAALLRHLLPPSRLQRASDAIDALTVANLALFAIAIMDGVTPFVLEHPRYAIAAIVLAFAANVLLQAAGALAFGRLGRPEALTVGLLSGNCNMGLVLVALAGRGRFEVTVFFALAQLPMYILPALLQPVYARLLARPPRAG